MVFLMPDNLCHKQTHSHETLIWIQVKNNHEVKTNSDLGVRVHGFNPKIDEGTIRHCGTGMDGQDSTLFPERKAGG